MDILEIAKLVEFNGKAECQAVFDYTEMINKTMTSEIDEEIKDKIIFVINELIADELNHEIKLRELYTFLTGIEAKED